MNIDSENRALDHIEIEIESSIESNLAGCDCCSEDNVYRPKKVACPGSGHEAKRVHQITVKSLVKPDKKSTILPLQYYYCDDPDCEVVYFAEGGYPRFTVDDLTVRVYDKDDGPDVNVCYCYGITRQALEDEYEQTGKSNAPLRIAVNIKTFGCSCETKNPRGACCLGEVRSIVDNQGSDK